MKKEKTETDFLSAGRNSIEEIKVQSGYFEDMKLFRQMIDAIPHLVVILNKNRQIVIANKFLDNFPEIRDIDVVGMRPGEALNCVNAGRKDGGCGTSVFCSVCGAANSIFNSQEFEEEDTRECRIIRNNGMDALDLRIKASPLEINDEKFSIVVITDISDEKRRRSLERIFFHDIMNIAGNIKGLFDILKRRLPELNDEYSDLLNRSIDTMIGEIHSQRILNNAENKELSVLHSAVNSMEILLEIIELYRFHRVADKREIKLDENTDEITFESDKTLLSRVLINMVKNALEASRAGDTITLGCNVAGDEVQFRVRNPQVMPEKVQLQIFQRSFSTKGTDRGLGTYSMKLLTERYLNGRISFSSSPGNGTVFTAVYPLK